IRDDLVTGVQTCALPIYNSDLAALFLGLHHSNHRRDIRRIRLEKPHGNKILLVQKRKKRKKRKTNSFIHCSRRKDFSSFSLRLISEERRVGKECIASSWS